VFVSSKVYGQILKLNLLNYVKQVDSSGLISDINVATFMGRPIFKDDSLDVSPTMSNAYILGRGSIIYSELGVRVPYEMARDAASAGGKTNLFSRKRAVLAPTGFSFLTPAVSKSATQAELENGANWGIVSTGTGIKLDPKFIPIARLVIGS
jgi:hypothetical protein